MLGIFQGNLPIGRGLWRIILILVLSGGLANSVISVSDKPVEFLIQTLFFYGHIIFLTITIMFIPIIIDSLMEKYFYDERNRLKSYKNLTDTVYSSIWLDIVGKLAFVIATVIAIPHYGSPRERYLGFIGIIIMLIIDILENLDKLVIKETKEILQLCKQSSSIVNVVIYIESGTYDFVIKSTLLQETFRLVNKGWNIINLSDSEVTFERIFKRQRSYKLREINQKEKRS